ncbi:retrovirus-related pol polyprotein from transposon TNT 1-94 [Tanacetum coccineum]
MMFLHISYERPEPIVIETNVSFDQHDQADQNDHSAQNDEILNNDQSEHSNHNNDNHFIDNLPNTEDVQIFEPMSYLAEDALVSNTIPIPTNPSLSILSMASLAPQDRWSQDKHIELVNIIGNPGAGMLTRAMAKELSAALAHECLFVDFLSKEEPKKVSEALKHLGWDDAMQEELNQFSRNKIKQSERVISINQEKYVKDLLKKYDINGSSVKTPMVPPNNLGPDLNAKSFDLKGYSDSDYVGCNIDRKSTSGAYQLLGGKLVCWSAKKQQSVAMSSAEAEYVVVAGCYANILWMKSQLTNYDIIYEKHWHWEAFTRSPDQYKEYLSDFWYTAKALKSSKVWFSNPTGGIIREVWVNTFRNSIGAHYLCHSTEYVATPPLETVKAWFRPLDIVGKFGLKELSKRVVFLLGGANGVNIDYAKLIWEDIITKLYKKTKEKVIPYPRFLSLLLELKMEGYGSKNVTLNPTQPSASTPVVAELHKEDQQATGGPTSLGVTNEYGAHPQLSSGMSASIHTKPIYSASTIIHSEFALEHDVSASSKAGADSSLSTPKDSIPQTTGKDEGPNKLSLDHIFEGTNPHALVEKTKSTSEGLETVITPPTTGKGASNIEKEIEKEFNTSPDLSSFDDALKDIKLEELSKLVHAEKVRTEEPKETTDASAPHPPSPNKSLPTELKELSSKFNDLSGEIKELRKYVEKLEVELPGDLKEIPNRLEKFTTIVSSLTTQVAELKTLQWELPAEFLSIPGQVSSIQAKIKTLDALLSLLSKVTKALDRFTQAVDQASLKAGDKGVPSAGQAGTHPVEGEKNTKQATITQIFKQRAEKDIIKKYKGKKAISSKDAKKEGTNSESNDANLTGSRVESSKQNKLKQFDFITEKGEHIHLTAEQIKEHKKLKDLAKADRAKQEVVLGKEELVDILGIDVVTKYYKAKLQYEKYCDKMLNRRALSRITNCDVLTRKGPITLKVYREDGTDEVIPNFKASDLHLGEWTEVMKACEHDPLDKLNDLARKKRKHADDIHKLFRLYQGPGMNQGPGLDDHARTFSSLLLAEVDKRILNPLKQMRVIEQLRLFVYSNKRRLLGSLEDSLRSKVSKFQVFIPYGRKCTALSAVKRFFLKKFSKTSNSSPWMHTRASNSELVEALSEPGRTLNSRLHRRNRRVPFERRNDRPEQPRVIYLPILDINYFRHFLNILENYNPMDDEPMWAADRVVAPTPGSAITIFETANEFTIKGSHLTLVKGNQFDGRIKTNPHKHIHEFNGICDMFIYRDTKNEAVHLMMFPLSLTGEAKTWLDELNEGTIETWDELCTTFISRFFPPALFDRLLREIRAFS